MYITEDEIRDAIINKVRQNGTIRLASIATRCNDESMFFKVLQELIKENVVNFDGNFIFLPKEHE